ncbi:MAG: TetR/AcrR family transcriptional regulator [Burkholderiaceae bacterium]
MAAFDETPPTQARLLDATARLTYTSGICATGMDLIVKASGVARKSIYRYYSTKETLVAAALQRRSERWMQWFIGEISGAPTPAERWSSIFPALRRWFESDNFRGCAFTNATGEIDNPNSPIRAVCRLHKQRLLDYLCQLAEACDVDDPKEAARQILVLIDGAISVALVTGDASIADCAGQVASKLAGIPAAGPSMHHFSPPNF